MNPLKLIVPLTVVLVGILGAWWLIANRPQVQTKAAPAEPPLVEFVRVRTESQALPVVSQGVVLPRTEMQLVAEVAGRVMKVHPAFAAGGFFHVDELLLQIDPVDYDLAITKAHALVAEANKELQRELAEVEQARREWRTLGGGKPSDYVMHVPQLAERRAKLAAAEASLHEAQLKRKRCEVRAPFNGRVRDKKVDVGQYVSAGEGLARLYATDFAEVRLPIANEQLALLDLPLAYSNSPAPIERPSVGLSAQVGDQIYQWQARIVRTEGMIDEQTGTLHAVARIDDPYRFNSERPPLMAGLFVQAQIAGKLRNNIFSLPERAMYRGSPRVMVIDDHERLTFRDVSVLRREQGQALITRGLKGGERVIVSGLDMPVEGMRVRTEPGALSAAVTSQQP